MNDGLIDATTPRQEPKPQGYASEAAPLYVRANHGRWLVSCQNCNGAELANPDDPWFWCHACFNRVAGHKLLPVVWPKNREAITALLRVRPAEARNWEPEETVDMLAAENIEHEDEIKTLRSENTRLRKL